MKIAYKEGIKKLLSEYSEVVKEGIEFGVAWRQKIENGKLSTTDQENILKDLCAQLLVQGRGSKGVGTQLDTIKEKKKKFGSGTLKILRRIWVISECQIKKCKN